MTKLKVNVSISDVYNLLSLYLYRTLPGLLFATVAAMALLNQRTEWKVGDVDFLSKFTDFTLQAQPMYSLALDGIADVTPSSAFYSTLTRDQRLLVSALSISDEDVDKKWPSLSSVLSRICTSWTSYDEVVKALENEPGNDRLINYFRTITDH